MTLLASGPLMATQIDNNKSFSNDQKKAIEQIVHEYLVDNPQVILEAANALQKKQQTNIMQKAQGAIRENYTSLFQAKTSPVLGNNKGQVTLVEFFDYQCPHCKEMSGTMKNLLNKYKNLKVIYKEFPIFPGSEAMSAAALASYKQGKYSVLHDALLEASSSLDQPGILKLAQDKGINVDRLKADMQNSDIKTEIENNMKLASQLGIMGTPSFIIAVNTDNQKHLYSIFIPGGVPQNGLEAAIDNALKHVK